MDALGHLSLRSYGHSGPTHHHDHVQVVLPLRGALSLEIDGRGGHVGPHGAAFVAPGAAHAQSAFGENRFLILDCTVHALGEEACERFSRKPFAPLAPGLRPLLDYVDVRRDGTLLAPTLASHVLPLLLDALSRPVAPLTRLQRLLARIEADPGDAWPVERMAATAQLSVSALHALFRRELDIPPQAWLSELRLRRVMNALAQSDIPVAQLATSGGWSDQTALTRAMRRATGLTPAAYRRVQRASGSKRS